MGSTSERKNKLHSTTCCQVGTGSGAIAARILPIRMTSHRCWCCDPYGRTSVDLVGQLGSLSEMLCSWRSECWSFADVASAFYSRGKWRPRTAALWSPAPEWTPGHAKKENRKRFEKTSVNTMRWAELRASLACIKAIVYYCGVTLREKQILYFDMS